MPTQYSPHYFFIFYVDYHVVHTYNLIISIYVVVRRSLFGSLSRSTSKHTLVRLIRLQYFLDDATFLLLFAGQIVSKFTNLV